MEIKILDQMEWLILRKCQCYQEFFKKVRNYFPPNFLTHQKICYRMNIYMIFHFSRQKSFINQFNWYFIFKFHIYYFYIYIFLLLFLFIIYLLFLFLLFLNYFIFIFLIIFNYILYYIYLFTFLIYYFLLTKMI